MGVPHPPEVSLLFIGILFSRPGVLDAVTGILTQTFGHVLFQNPPRTWDFSSYYARELGAPVFRTFIFFDAFIDPLSLSDIKLATNDIEVRFSKDSKRTFNLDPGYLTLSRVVLASTKDYPHRIYLGKGIYGEVALYYKGKAYHPLPFTYNDYKDKEYQHLFEQARKRLKEKITASK